MTTITQTTGVYSTDRRNRRKLLSLTAAYRLTNFTMKTVTLTNGQSELVPISKVFLATFTIPTLIRIGNGLGATVDLTVIGTVSIPTAGSVEIIYPLASTTQEPLTVTYVAG